MNDALNEAKRIYCIYKQGNDNFNNVVIIVEYYGDDLFGDDTLVTHEKKISTNLSDSSKRQTLSMELLCEKKWWGRTTQKD